MDGFFVETVKIHTVATVKQRHCRSHYNYVFQEIHASSTDVPKHQPKHVCFKKSSKQNTFFFFALERYSAYIF